MNRFAAALPLLVLAACAPPQSATGPEATVTAIYDTLAKSKGAQSTPVSAIPMTAELAALTRQAEATTAPDEAPVFDGDIAGNCQDCTEFSGLKIERSAATAPAGHTLVDAHFTLFQKEPRNVQWDLVETPEGWKVDNIVSDGFNVRAIASEVIAAAAAAPPPAPESAPAPEAATPETPPATH